MRHSDPGHSKYLSTNLSRRELLRWLGLTTAGLFARPAPSSCQTRQIINFWGTDTLDIGDAGWKHLEAKSNISVRFYDNGNDPGPVVRKLVQGNQASWRHVSGLQGGAEPELARQMAILPWDTTKLKNYHKLWWDLVQDIPYTVLQDKCYGIPTVINGDSMIYRADLAGHVDSYEAIFSPVLAGKTAMEDAWINSVILTAIYLKESGHQKIEDPGNLTETELRGVMEFLKNKAKAGQFRRLWSGWGEAVEMITSGEVYVMTGWEPIAIEAASRGVNAKYAEPKEGFEGWSNDLLLHPGAERDGVYDAAHTLADWELSGYYGCAIANRSGYAVPTDEAERYAEDHPKEFDPQVIKNKVARVKRKFLQMKGKTYWQNVMPDNKDLYEEEWAKFRAIVNDAAG